MKIDDFKEWAIGQWPAAKNIKSEHIWNFLRFKRGVENCADATIRLYTYNLGEFEQFLSQHGKNILDIDKSIIDDWLSTFKKPNTKAQKICTAKSLYSFLYDRDIIKTKLLRDYKLRQQKLSKISSDDLLTENEVKQMIEATKKYKGRKATPLMIRTCIYMYISSGARLKEILSLYANDLVLSEHRTKMRPRKWGYKGYIYFSKQATLSLKHYIMMNEASIKKRKGRIFPIASVTFWYILKQLGKIAGIDKNIHPHLFRHMWTTRSKLGKMDDTIIQELAGWTSPKMLIRYSHFDEEIKKKEFKRIHG